jgi:hypothetical protein
MLTALWRVLPLAPRLSKKGSSVKLSPRPVTRPHALDRLFVLLSTGRLFPKLFYPHSWGCPAISGSALPSHPNTILVCPDIGFPGYIDDCEQRGTLLPGLKHLGFRYPCTPSSLDVGLPPQIDMLKMVPPRTHLSLSSEYFAMAFTLLGLSRL